MVYTLLFKHEGKTLSNYQIVEEKFLQNQFEAVALGLLLWKIEHEGLSRGICYHDLCLLEYDESKGVVNPVWSAKVYLPYSEEVK